jgi:nucleoside-diphosphate-sugar epimerase
MGNECIILDNITDYGFINKEELSYLKSERLKRINANVHHIDLRDHKAVEDFFRSFSFDAGCVIHLASFPRQKVVQKNPTWGSDVMSTGLVNILELTKNFKIPKFVYVSSSMVYGDFNNDVKEDQLCDPIGQYGIMKYMGEQLVKDYTRRGYFDHVVVRPSAVYGEYDVEDRVVSKFVLNALRGETLKINGAQEVLDFTHVDDTSMGIALASTKKEALNNTYNITHSDFHFHTLLDAAAMIIKLVGKGKIDIQSKDMNFPSRGRLSINAARKDLGFNPQIDIETGFNQYIRWFKESPYWQNRI